VLRLALALALFPGAAAAAQPSGLAHVPAVPEPIARTAEEAARVEAVTRPATDFSAPEPFEARPGGAATSGKPVDANAFSFSSANMPFERELDFKVGNGFFRKLWVTAPSSTASSDGLGPLFNARSCQSCHLKDGRGHPPTGPDDPAVGILFRLSVPADAADPSLPTAAIEDYLATLPEGTYGGQLQTFAVPGLRAEGGMGIDYQEVPVTLGDGEVVSLRRPSYRITDPAWGPLDPRTMISPRVAPQMIGLGLLEAVPEADVLALADPDDADGDGISGRPNIVRSETTGGPMLGRFGAKAGQPTIRDQAASAFSADLGISTALHPDGGGDCTGAQAACLARPDGGAPEADATALDLVTFYSRNLAVPARRDLDDPQVLEGKRVFYAAGCPACHQPKFVTDRLEGQPEQSFQLIWPYTDLLLHDMGEGLADHRPEARATGTEWRTAPLWGIGLTGTVTGQASFLHDGRARTLMEAVLWHGGEAEAARERVTQLPKAEREALIRFLESL
jgi:CxxC motif-containing protein (DUF1111 family)